MNINDRKIKWKFPSIFFENNYSNGSFIFIISIIILNYLFLFAGWSNFSIEELSIIIFVLVLIIVWAASISEAFKDYAEPESALADLKRATLYMFIGAFVVGIIHFYKVNNYATSSDKSDKNVTKIQIASFKFVDLHAKKDTYIIKYYDKYGRELFTDIYSTKAYRDKVKALIYKNGEVVVDMVYINDGDEERVEISQKVVHLKSK